ncbi:hypothetical protein F5B17DRAFT_10904 [Nemania serpens]|nr:hypothetical protein F5B17DRAFT_10904 [Nemania serpens]
MPILSLGVPLSSSHIGLRAVIRASEACLASVAIPAVRAFSTNRPLSRPPCFQYSAWGVVRPSKTPFNRISRNTIPRVHVRTIFAFRAITRYIDLPDSYRDAEGLPFRREDLTQKEANRIFPSNLPAPQANLLLKILHGRRVAGTLDDPTLAVNTREFRIADQKRALAYLREHIPVDEVLNAGLRAEDELEVIEQQETADSGTEAESEVTTSPPTPSSTPSSTPSPTQAEPAEAPTGRLPKKPGSDSPYGESNLDRIRAANIAKREAEEARLEEERQKRVEELASEHVGTLQTELAKPREMSAFRKKYMERATSDLEDVPEMSVWRRLLPTMGVAVLVVAASMAFAALYQAPPASRRLWPDIPPAAATCLALIAANVAVWALWKFPPAWVFMNRYMLVVASTPRPLQIVGATFSHQSFKHLVPNMMLLWIFGTRVHDEIGRGNFLALYLSSGAIGFAASLLHLVLWRGLTFTTLGASGGVYAVVTAYFWMYKFDEFKILGYPPDPISGPQGLGFLGLILGTHLVPLFSKRIHNVDMVSHLAGMVVGALGIDLIRSYMDHKARVRAEKLRRAGVLDRVFGNRDLSSPPIVGAPLPSPSPSPSPSK